ncbi:hypothetical protein D3C85_847640 [compost metagenome]
MSFPVYPKLALNFKSEIVELLAKNDSLLIFHPKATEGKLSHFAPSANTDEPSHLLDAVNKYLSLKV